MKAEERIGAQVAAKNIGEAGCYFLSILHCFASPGQALAEYWHAIDQGWLDDDCLVKEAGGLASNLFGKPVECRKEAKDYATKPGEVEILRFEVEKTGATYSHFVVGDGAGNVAWDPWPNSLTVKNGKLAGKRIFAPKV